MPREDDSVALTESATLGHAERDAYVALRYRDFRLLLAGRFLATLGEQMLAVALGWEIYARTRSPFALGLVGLVQVLPVFLLSLPAGHLADRRDRLRIVIVTDGLLALGALGLFGLSASRGPLPMVFACNALLGVARAFNDPAGSTLLPQIVPAAHFANAATWSSSSWQLAAVAGPAAGGLLIALTGGATPIYALNVVLYIAVVGLLLLIHSRPSRPEPPEGTALESLREGLGFLRRTRIILAAITLDLFAVLLGGAVTLLPIYATDVLKVGPTGLGLMRAAPSAGAVLMALAQAHLPPLRRALLMLATLGALDNISVVIRSTLLLVRAPDALRGRVASVNSMFVGASNELGGFESGTMAQLIGPVGSVVSGGVGTLLVVVAVALIWPELRTLGRLAEH